MSNICANGVFENENEKHFVFETIQTKKYASKISIQNSLIFGQQFKKNSYCKAHTY